MYNRGTAVCVASASDYSWSEPPGVPRYSGANHTNTVCQVKTDCAGDTGGGIWGVHPHKSGLFGAAEREHFLLASSWTWQNYQKNVKCQLSQSQGNQRAETPHTRLLALATTPVQTVGPVNKSLCFVLNKKHLGIVCWVEKHKPCPSIFSWASRNFANECSRGGEWSFFWSAVKCISKAEVNIPRKRSTEQRSCLIGCVFSSGTVLYE